MFDSVASGPWMFHGETHFDRRRRFGFQTVSDLEHEWLVRPGIDHMSLPKVLLSRWFLFFKGGIWTIVPLEGNHHYPFIKPLFKPVSFPKTEVVLPLTPMDDNGKAAAEASLKTLRADGQTNLWQATKLTNEVEWMDFWKLVKRHGIFSKRWKTIYDKV